MKAPRLTWKREPNETGLARVCQGKRGWDLRINGNRIAMVRPWTKGFDRTVRGWYWYGGSDALAVPRMNTCDSPTKTSEEACAECEAHVRKALGLPPKKIKAPAQDLTAMPAPPTGGAR